MKVTHTHTHTHTHITHHTSHILKYKLKNNYTRILQSGS